MNTDEHEPSPFEHVESNHGVYDRTSAPTTCASNEDATLGKCFAKCTSGYAPIDGAPMTCGAACPSGYEDDGFTCYRGLTTVAANMGGCFSSLSCDANLLLGCMVCPSGFEPKDACECWAPPDTITKATYDRSASATAFDTCAAGEEQEGTLCYAACKAGFHAVAAMCLPD